MGLPFLIALLGAIFLVWSGFPRIQPGKDDPKGPWVTLFNLGWGLVVVGWLFMGTVVLR